MFNDQTEFFFYEIFSRFSTNITHSNEKDDKRINKQKQIGWMESNRTPHSMPSFFFLSLPYWLRIYKEKNILAEKKHYYRISLMKKKTPSSASIVVVIERAKEKKKKEELVRS